MRLIIATGNKGKLKEMKHVLGGLGVSIVSLADLDRKFSIKENGDTFFKNAVKKAMPVSNFYKRDLVVGEDSGLEVDFLSGRPGVRSRRYAGASAEDSDNNRKLLKELSGLHWRRRTANFRCVLVLMRAGSLVDSFQGVLRGRIAAEPRGKGGFGYDPVFYLPEYKKTAAEISLSMKNKISHRGQVLRKLRKYLVQKSI